MKPELCFYAIVLGLLITVSSVIAEPVKIGVMLPLTGPLEAWGGRLRSGIEQAQSQGFELIFEDTQCEPAKAVTAYKKLSSVDNVNLFLGPACASSQNALAPLIAKQDQLAMLPTSSSELLYDISDKKMLAVHYSIEAESGFNAGLLEWKQLEKTVIVYVDNQFGRRHEEVFRQIYRGKVVEVFRLPAFDASYIKPIVARMKKLDFNALYMPDVSPMLLGILTEMSRMDIEGKAVFSIYSAELPELIKVEGKHADKLWYSYPDIGKADDSSYFSKLAADLFVKAAGECEGQAACMHRKLFKQRSFNRNGVLQSKIVLKQIRDGEYVQLEPGK